MANEGYHEPVEELSDETRDMHRAITSLMEELEAVDWYNQRVDACKDKELKAILEHNRDEEKEHAAMVLEWIRRRDSVLDKELKDYLFTDKKIGHQSTEKSANDTCRGRITKTKKGNDTSRSGKGFHLETETLLKLNSQKDQKSFAIVLDCSDSRVPAEIVFEQGIDDLFVIRVAGNIVAPS